VSCDCPESAKQGAFCTSCGRALEGARIRDCSPIRVRQIGPREILCVGAAHRQEEITRAVCDALAEAGLRLASREESYWLKKDGKVIIIRTQEEAIWRKLCRWVEVTIEKRDTDLVIKTDGRLWFFWLIFDVAAGFFCWPLLVFVPVSLERRFRFLPAVTRAVRKHLAAEYE